MLDFRDQLAVFVFSRVPCLLLFGGVPGNPRCFEKIPGGVSTLTAGPGEDVEAQNGCHLTKARWTKQLLSVGVSWLFVAGIPGGGFIFDFKFSPLFGEIIQFDQYFSDGLNQTTNSDHFRPLEKWKMKTRQFQALRDMGFFEL